MPCLQISSCDHILATMEDMLGKFQADLGNISTEIRALQEQSQSMSVKLKNRKGTEQKLGQFIDSIAIPGEQGVLSQAVYIFYSGVARLDTDQGIAFDGLPGVDTVSLGLSIDIIGEQGLQDRAVVGASSERHEVLLSCCGSAAASGILLSLPVLQHCSVLHI